jgi:hypothetical protein
VPGIEPAWRAVETGQGAQKQRNAVVAQPSEMDLKAIFTVQRADQEFVGGAGAESESDHLLRIEGRQLRLGRQGGSERREGTDRRRQARDTEHRPTSVGASRGVNNVG